MSDRPASLALSEYNDIDLLTIVSDLTDTDSGWADAELIADRTGVQHREPLRCVAMRMSWMRRYGAIEFNPDDKYSYRLTDEGERIIKKGSLTAAQRKAVEGLADHQLLAAMASMGSLYGSASNLAATLMRRHWRYQIGR